jgi:hypothetical protein
MSNRIEEATLPAGTEPRVGTPADRPQEAIEALITFFSTKENVVYAGLGLMEMIYPEGKSEVCYTIGIECSSDAAATIQQAAEVLLKVPAARWPISVVPAKSQFFPNDVVPFFGKKPERSWLHRLLHFDLNSLLAKRRIDQTSGTAAAGASSAAHASPNKEASPNKDLEAAIHRVVTNPSPASGQMLYEILLECHLLVGVQDLPEGVSSFPATLEADTPCAMATSVNSDGREVLLAFSNADEVQARNPSVGYLEMRARTVLELGVQNNLEGIVINPAGEWIEIGAEEIKTMLNTAK